MTWTAKDIKGAVVEKRPLNISQTKFGKDKGNCLTACVACLTGIPISDLPDLYSHSGIEWWDTLYAWCKDNGYGLIYFNEEQPRALLLGTYGIGAFTVEGSEEMHAVILEYKMQMNGEEWIWEAFVYHDPNPKKPKLVDLKFHIFLQPNQAIDAQSSVKYRMNREKLAETIFIYDHEHIHAGYTPWKECGEVFKGPYLKRADKIIASDKEIVELDKE